MRFRFNADQGSYIAIWLVPDNPLATSRVHVSVEGQRIATLEATDVFEQARTMGWHTTGLCFFRITQAQVPGLREIERLEIHDADTNILIYRRIPQEGMVDARVMLITTGIHPETALQSALYPYFRQNHFGIGSLSEEVLLCLFKQDALTSCLFAGALLMHRYEANLVRAEAQTMMLVQDPFIEMATRLQWLRERAELTRDRRQAWRLGELAEDAPFVFEYDFSDARSLRRLFNMLPEPAYRLFYNPLTHQLSTALPNERIRPSNSIVAVEVLSRIGIVGHRDHYEAFATTVFDRFGIDAPIPQPRPISDETVALAERLRSIKIARDMVNFDCVISDAVRKSVAKSWAV